MSAFLKLNKSDFYKSLVVVVLASILPVINESVQSGSFDIFSYDWVWIGKLAINAAGAYLLKNLLTAENGKVLGRI